MLESRKIEELLAICPKLCEWIKLEPSFTQASGRIYTVLGELLGVLTEDFRWNECGSIADALYSTAYLIPDKAKAHKNLSSHALKNIATEKI
ncbi:MAG: hypothetical protein HC887_02340 [Desulfobacteraceae bacterium]|nr:hypothetical protein [Desulfobacteraceae bacterium]